jgi:hypothetical protein
MRSMSRILHALLVTCLFLAAAAAQARKPLLGTVVDGGGKPIAGATVECVLAPDGPHLPPLDLLTATTDERGRFRVEALPCASYRCWAVTAKDEDGAQFVSEVVATAVGQLAALVAKTRGGAGTIALRGLDAWQDRAPFTLRCIVAGRAVDSAVAGDDGAFTALAPVRPAGGMEAQILDRDGFHVHRGNLAPRASRFSVPTPQAVRCRVVDANGQPIAGARIHKLRHPDSYTSEQGDPGMRLSERGPTPDELVGVAGDDGVAVVRVAAARSPLAEAQRGVFAPFCFRADAPGRRASYAGRGWNGIFEDGKVVAEQTDRTGFTFTLQPAEPQRFRLVDGDAPLADIAVSLTFGITEQNDGVFGQVLLDVLRATTDADGRFALGRVPEHGAQARMQLAVGSPAATAPGGVPFAVRPALLHPQTAETAPDGERRINVGALATVVLVASDSDGGPGRGLQLGLVSASAARHTFTFHDLHLLTPDTAGRVAVRLEPGMWCAVACSQSGLVVKEFDAATTPMLELAVAPLPTFRARVVNADGKPLAGATFVVAAYSWEGHEDNALDRLSGLLSLNWNNALLQRGRSGEDGTFRVGIVAAGGWGVRGSFQLRGKQSDQFEVRVGDLGDVVVK